jgi:hypothetical protein
LWFELPGEGELVNVELYSLQGQKMYSNILRNEGNNMLQLPSNIGNGVYVLIVRKGIKMYSQRLLLSR